MESADELKIAVEKHPERKQVLEQWLSTVCGLSSFTLQALSGDASFRHYIRVQAPSHTYMLMDAEKEQASCHAYIAIANALRQIGLHTPDIMQADLQKGLLLLTDFGDVTYLKALTMDNADGLYHHALDALALLQNCRQVSDHAIPFFTRDIMLREWAWFKEWFLTKLLHLSLPAAEEELDKCYDVLVEAALTQPQVFMHRDYHSANLMVLPDQKVGVLDFQDAFIGPVTYDAVSLLRDCYIDWPEAKVSAWAINYLHKLHRVGVVKEVDEETFLRWFDWMGMQRHLKALLTFARKEVRDGHSRYLHFIPRTLKYVVTISQRYPEFAVLHDYLRVTVQPTFERIYPCQP